MYKRFYFLWISLLLVGNLSASQAFAETIYKKNFDKIRLIPLDSDITMGEPVEHPYTISEQKIHNMLASLHFGRRLLILKDVEEIRLFDKRGLELLAPYLAQAFQKAGPDQMVQFTYIKKAPHWRVIRNDRLISGKAFIRNGELFIKFTKLYAKVFGDYQRAGKEERFFNSAKDIGSSLESKPGQRTIDSKFIALKIDHDYLADLEKLAEEEKAAKKQAEDREQIKGIPLPEKATERSTAKATPASPANRSEPALSEETATPEDGDITARLETLKELRKKKLISEREYQKKRKEILGDL